MVMHTSLCVIVQENLQARVDSVFPLVDIMAISYDSVTSLCLSVRSGARRVRIQCYTKERADDWHRDLSYHALKKDK